MLRWTIVNSICVLALNINCPAIGAEQDRGTLIINESAYCRSFYQLDVQRIGPKALKAEGEKILGATLMNRLEKQVKKRLASKNYDWQKEDWREHVTSPVEYNSFARKNKVFLTVESITQPPADAWRGLEFDDSTWPRQKKPDGVGSPAEYTYDTLERNGWLRGIFLRFRFEIPDPATAGSVTLSADFIGGLRAFVNGTEIVREHLPAGEFDAETMADEYPQEAYGFTFAELPEKDKAPFKGKEPPPTEIVKSADELTPIGSRLYKARSRTINALTIPRKLLHKGTNVLAIELRAAPLHPYALKNWFGYRGEDRQWEHAHLSRLELRCASKEMPSSLSRPKGVQMWTEYLNRRMFLQEYLEAGAAPGVVRLVGARNGTYSAQVVVGTDKELANVKVSVSELKDASGKLLPVTVFGMVPQPMSDISTLGEGRINSGESFEFGGGNNKHGDWSAPKTRALNRFAPETLENKDAATAALGRIQYFDWISIAQPARIPANSTRPYWLSVKIPADAAPGKYHGSVRVEGPSFAAATLPVEVEVLEWKIPDPRDFQTVVAIEQSPYGVAKQYKTPLWSEKHWELVEASLRQLARVGNRCWIVPVLLETEFGNKDDSTIKWIRKKDGTLSFDYATLDRYLDLIVKNCGTPRVISFVVMHGFQGAMEVKVLDEATGKEERLNLGPAVKDREKYWQPFATSLYSHMTAKGLNQAMYWGYPWDSDGDPALKPMLRKFAPEVFWTCGSHDANVSVSNGMPDISSPFYVGSPFGSRAWDGKVDTSAANFYKVVENIQSFLIEGESKKGWKIRDQILLCTPRVDCGAIVVNGTAAPWAFRIFPERSIFTGYQGTGRAGGDYWAKSYHDGCKHYGGAPGFSIMKALWPGPDGAEPSARFEAMIEGLQELEARTFVEQALERGILSAEQTRHVTEQLDRHYKGTFAGGLDWQARSKAMYQLAAEVAAIIGPNKK
ncbi:MAG TPA: glycoside hydrolase domain-containing protein [Planctomycetota bacterium]|nr:glycoside hydrolase domain-containing protein [Planctomycetota bacterium]